MQDRPSRLLKKSLVHFRCGFAGVHCPKRLQRVDVFTVDTNRCSDEH